MIKLITNGNLKEVKVYNTVYEAKVDLIQRNAEKYLVEYCDKIYGINKFLALIEGGEEK
jgi:hypothetical protein